MKKHGGREREKEVKFLEVIEGVVREMLTMPKPNKWFPPEVLDVSEDEDGYPVMTIKASNYRDVDNFVPQIHSGTWHKAFSKGGEGRRIVATHIGRYLWELHTEPNPDAVPARPRKRNKYG